MFRFESKVRARLRVGVGTGARAVQGEGEVEGEVGKGGRGGEWGMGGGGVGRGCGRVSEAQCSASKPINESWLAQVVRQILEALWPPVSLLRSVILLAQPLANFLFSRVIAFYRNEGTPSKLIPGRS